ncbi:MAG: YihY family inner membrane protein [Opitutaceae bacterium]|jgi:membrane protein|nr:YihY family inner membrane protein [Opitutaceae bacterium]
MPIATFIRRCTRIYRHEIWRPDFLTDRSLRGRVYALLRVVSITVTGIVETKAFSRAAALSFSSMLGLGPLVAIAMLVAGFVLDRQDPHLAVNTLNRVIKFIAPQVTQYEQLDDGFDMEGAAGEVAGDRPVRSDIVSAATLHLRPRGVAQQARASQAAASPAVRGPDSLAAAPGAGAATDPAADEGQVEVNPELVKLIDGFIDGSKSSTAGVVGVITLIVIVLQLFTTVENVFNEIWGVRRGRSWTMRIVWYWTVLTLGAVLFFATVTALSAGAYLNFFKKNMPFGLGETIAPLLGWMLPSLSIMMLAGVLTLFYKFIPNTRVLWRGAATGAAVVAALVVANNYLAFLYLSKVVQQRSFFGSLGILPILMFGLYIFWLFILLGGQVSYAVQNVQYRNSQAAWNTLAESMRERLSLTVLLRIGRRFRDCLPPCTASDLGAQLGVPTQVLNECLNRLVQMTLLSPVPPSDEGTGTELRYQPARPLNRMTLADFKQLDDDHGGPPAGPAPLVDADPIVHRYDRELKAQRQREFFTKTLDELIAESPMPAIRG